MAEIEGMQFTLFWDCDRDDLRKLSFDGRAQWLEERIRETLLGPIDVLARTESAFPWLAVTELVCAGIEALAGFYGKRERNDTSFCGFVHQFMSPDFSENIAANKKGENWTYCQHLKQYFRNALGHGFAVEWGGLWFSNEPGLEGYLRRNKGDKGIAVCPRLLREDFREAVRKYFTRLREQGKTSTIGRDFIKHFDAILEDNQRRK